MSTDWFFPWAVLLAAQLAGEILVSLTGVLIPGAVLGLLLLLGAFYLWPGLHPRMAPFCRKLTRNMLMLYVPASVGIAWIVPELQQGALAIALCTTVGTWVTAAVAAATLAALERRRA